MVCISINPDLPHLSKEILDLTSLTSIRHSKVSPPTPRVTTWIKRLGLIGLHLWLKWFYIHNKDLQGVSGIISTVSSLKLCLLNENLNVAKCLVHDRYKPECDVFKGCFLWSKYVTDFFPSQVEQDCRTCKHILCGIVCQSPDCSQRLDWLITIYVKLTQT